MAGLGCEVVGCGGCGLVCDWVAVVVGFVVGGGFFLLIVVGSGGWQRWVCFTLLQTHNVEYFLEHFPRVQTNIGKTNIFP